MKTELKIGLGFWKPMMEAGFFRPFSGRTGFSGGVKIKKVLMASVIALILCGLLTFAPAPVAGQIWLEGWQYRKKITIDETKVDADLTDFPTLVKLTSSNLDFSKARSDGYDIRFTDSDGTTLLKYERERHDQANSLAEYWVKVPAVSGTVDTDIYIYYGKSDAADGAEPSNVWDSSCKMVQHLQETSGSYYDSTSNNNDGTAPSLDPGDVSINSCDETTDWTGTDVYLDTTDMKEGTASLVDAVASPVIGTNYITSYNPADPLGLGNRAVDFWFKCDRVHPLAGAKSFDSARVYIYDTLGNWRYHDMFFKYAETWKRFHFGVGSGGTTSPTPPDPSSIDRIEWQFVAKDGTNFYKKIDIVYANGRAGRDVDGQIDGGDKFDGADDPTGDYVDFGDAETLDFDTGDFMIEAWIKTQETKLRHMIAKQTYDVRPPRGYVLQINQGKLEVIFYDGRTRNLGASTATINDNLWHHIAVTFDRDANATYYIDGNIDKEIDMSTFVGSVSNDKSFLLAKQFTDYQHIYVYYFAGTMDEVRISDTVRSAAWIRASFYSAKDTLLTYGEAPNAPTFPLCEGETNPTNVTDTTPEFSWTFSDNDSGDTQSACQIIVGTSPGGSNMWDSGKVETEDWVNGVSTVSYAGTTLSLAGSKYYWQVKTWDNHDVGGEYCVAQHFTMTATSSFSVTASTPQIVGSEFTLTITALDEQGNTATYFSGTVNLTVDYVSPTSGSGTLSVTSTANFVTGIATITNQTFSDCGTITITATKSDDESITGTSSNIVFVPYDFTVVASGLDSAATTRSYGRHTVNESFTLTVTARNASGVTCPNYQGRADLTINYTSPSTDQSGSLGTSSLTSTYWTRGIAKLTNMTYNKWGRITITATDTTLTTQTGTSSNIIFLPKDFSISLSDPPASRTFYYTNEGFSTTITARDYNNSTISNYQGTISFSGAGLNLPLDYTFTTTDAGSHKFKGLNGSVEKKTNFSIKDTSYTAISATSATISIKEGTIKVYSTSGPVGKQSVRVKILDSQGKVIEEDDATTFIITLVEFMPDDSATCETTSLPAQMKNGGTTIYVTDNEAETVTVTPSATPTLKAVSGKVRFGTVSGSGIGIDYWREITKPYEEEE